jgi:hypothetical protein
VCGRRRPAAEEAEGGGGDVEDGERAAHQRGLKEDYSFFFVFTVLTPVQCPLVSPITWRTEATCPVSTRFPYHVEDGGGVVIIFQMDGDERGLDVDLKGELS